jgi:hypothetical protein
MAARFVIVSLASFALSGVALAQIATSNEDGATGAYSDEIGSSHLSEGRFGPRTALDDLRADVDRGRELREKLRQRAAEAALDEGDEGEGEDSENSAVSDGTKPVVQGGS